MENSKSKFSGLTDDQVLALCSQIASNANLLADFCRAEADRHHASDVSLTFHVMATMLGSMGAMADMPTGGDVVGPFAAWMIGPLFGAVASS